MPSPACTRPQYIHSSTLALQVSVEPQRCANRPNHYPPHNRRLLLNLTVELLPSLNCSLRYTSSITGVCTGQRFSYSTLSVSDEDTLGGRYEDVRTCTQQSKSTLSTVSRCRRVIVVCSESWSRGLLPLRWMEDGRDVRYC